MLWNGRKWTGSPKKLHKKVTKEFSKQKSSGFHNLSEDDILLGWQFDCCCGASGKNFDDGKRSLQCDICKLWMHNRCNNIPEKSSDLMLHFYRKRVWVCDKCRTGDFKHRASIWKVTDNEEKEKTKVTFSEADYSDLVQQKPKSELSIKEQKLSQTVIPMLRRRNAGDQKTISSWVGRRNGDCGLSLQTWMAHYRQESDEPGEEIEFPTDQFTY